MQTAAEVPHTQALPEEATEEHPESSDVWKQSTANMKKEKDESYIFSRFVFFVRADCGNDFQTRSKVRTSG